MNNYNHKTSFTFLPQNKKNKIMLCCVDITIPF